MTKRPKQNLNSDVASYHSLVSQSTTVRTMNNKALDVEPLEFGGTLQIADKEIRDAHHPVYQFYVHIKHLLKEFLKGLRVMEPGDVWRWIYSVTRIKWKMFILQRVLVYNGDIFLEHCYFLL